MAAQLNLHEATRDALRAELSGRLLGPQDDGYEQARKIHNGMIDRHPKLIVACAGTADVVAAVRFAAAADLEIAVRGGGHNVAGNAVCNGGLMIDLSPMRGVFVDPERRIVRAQGGVTWGQFNRETQLHGLATTGGVVSTTGVGGLTLGGGLGWLMAKHGLAVDNLVSAEVVTAAGDVLRASAEENPDLFWAVRGGGGNFGVVTSFEFRLHPVGPMVVGGLVAHPFDRAGDVLRFFREVSDSIPDELTMFAALLHAPDGSGTKVAAIIVCHCGPVAQGEADVRRIKEFEAPIMDVIQPMPYTAVNMMLDDGFPKGALNYWKSSFVAELSDDAIDSAVEQFARCPSPMSGLLFEHFHGAATRIPEGDTAFPHRSQGYNCLVASEWVDPAASDANVAWGRAAYDALQPYFARGVYVNYVGETEGESTVAAAYGSNYARLRALKSRYDPKNRFHLNQNIPPQ